MKKQYLWLLLAELAFIIAGAAGAAFAAESFPHNWQMGFQPAASPVAEEIHRLHNMLMYLVCGIGGFVFVLLLIVIFRFNAKANPKPATFSHNTMIEVIWTVVPVVILIVIAIPSMKLIYFMDRTVEPEMTLKITGYQWYWGYEYPDHDGLTFMSYMIPDDEIDESKGQRRLLSTDTQIVLPIDTNIQILITAADVIHAWAVPAFGIKQDAVPGRLNETWVRITKPGIYYGQCSELCGKDHAYMPIEVKAVTKEEFKRWVRKAKRDFASATGILNQPVQLAQIEDIE